MTERLRVGTFITQYPYEGEPAGAENYFVSGAERVARQLCEELAALDCDVTVCTSAAGTEYTTEQQGAVTIERSPSIKKVNTTQIAPTQFVDPLWKGLEFDIVHAHNSTPPGVLAGWLYATYHDVPLVITHHGGENYESHGSLFRRASLFAYTNVVLAQLLGAADAAVSPTDGYIRESGGLSTANTTVIPNGVDSEAFAIEESSEAAKAQLGIDPDTFFVLYLGSLHPRKGVDVLLDGFVQFHDDHPESRLCIGGTGQLREEMQATVEREGVADVVDVPGFIPESEKALYMTAADAFVLPSITPGSEVFPLVLLEAAAARTPVVASRFETIESIVTPNEIGALLEPGSAASVAAELGALYADEDRRERLADNALELARELDWANIATRYRDLYGRLVA